MVGNLRDAYLGSIRATGSEHRIGVVKRCTRGWILVSVLQPDRSASGLCLEAGCVFCGLKKARIRKRAWLRYLVYLCICVVIEAVK